MKKILAAVLLLALGGSAYAQTIAGGGGSGGGGGGGSVTQGTSPWVDNITQVGGNPLTIGQSLMVSAVPVTVASDQTPVQPKQYTGTTVTRPANTTAYAAGQLFYSTATAGTALDGATIQISRTTNPATLYNLSLSFSSATLTNKIMRVHLYNVQPTFSSGDGGTWLTSKAGYQGCFDVTVDKAFSDGSVGRGIPCSGSVIEAAPVSGQNYDYYAIEVRAAYAPASGETVTPTIEVP